MSIKAVLFDLDGTLLPMDQDEFVAAYMKNLAAHMMQHGYDPRQVVDSIWKGTGAMIKNDGTCSNEEAFWRVFCSIFGEDARKDEPKFDRFYRTDFANVQQSCGFNECAAQVIALLRSKGLRTALATNPIFPAIATQSRIRWAGLQPEDFELYTTYENSRFCKPNLDYYREVLGKMDLKAEECLMVGNDVGEDMIARELGCDVFLLTDCLINKVEKNIDDYPNGGFDELLEYIAAL